MSCTITYKGQTYTEEDFLEYIKNNLPSSSTLNNPSEFVNHSGGAYGGDTMWDQIGREFGVTEHKHYRDAGNTSLSQKLRNNKVQATVLTSEQMEEARAQVEKLLGKKFPNTIQGNLQVRNYYQVANADAVYAIATLNDSKTGVSGGTNTAVQLGIKLNKPIYVWDTNTEQWYRFNGSQNNSAIVQNKWTKDLPKENPNTAYIFTENINSIGSSRVGGGSAVIRNNPNAIGIVTKKYYVYAEDRATSKVTGGWNQNFKDTEADFELFKKVNLEQFAKIDEYDSKIFPQGFASDLAKIPTRFAEWLQDELSNRYGLITELNATKTGLVSKNIQSVGVFQKTETPTLTKNFAGVGTRDIENYNTLDKTPNKWTPRKEYLGDEKALAAQQAIRDVYEKTFNESKQGSKQDIEGFKNYVNNTSLVAGQTQQQTTPIIKPQRSIEEITFSKLSKYGFVDVITTNKNNKEFIDALVKYVLKEQGHDFKTVVEINKHFTLLKNQGTPFSIKEYFTVEDIEAGKTRVRLNLANLVENEIDDGPVSLGNINFQSGSGYEYEARNAFNCK